MTPRLSVVAGLVCLLILAVAPRSGAEEAYYAVPFSKIVTEKAGPATDNSIFYTDFRRRELIRPYAVLDGPGEVVARLPQDYPWQRIQGREGTLHIRCPAGEQISGIAFVPVNDGMKLARVPFKVDAKQYASDRKAYMEARLSHYQALLDQRLAGAAWFRYQAHEAAQELGGLVVRERPEWQERFRPGQNFDDTIALFGGGRAVAENLQLDRALPPATQPGEESVKLESITGIDVAEMDWKKQIEGKSPRLDPLAKLIPADQHAVFFPTFAAAVALIDEAQKRGSVLLMAAEETSEDALTQQRYERQLCLPLAGLGRMLGPALVKSVAVTGSDPYLRTGSDVAVFFEAANSAALESALAAQLALVGKVNLAAKGVSGEIEGIKYSGLVAPDRSVCTYRATMGDAVVVTNSLAQLKCIVAAQQGKTPALAAAPEYIFFRDRYALGDAEETALIVLSDATIRRWCGPRWRIGDSRRTRASAVMMNLEMQNAAAIAAGDAPQKALSADRFVPHIGELRLSHNAIVSSTYGTNEFLTPIRELEFDAVTKEEADAYKRWRDGYQENWRNYFDPIAVRLTVREGRIGADLTVMPLIVRTEYRQIIDATSGVALKPTSGDPHDAIGHFAMAINPDSETVKGFGRMFQTMSGNLRIDPLGWLGGAVAVYADESPFWAELAQATNSAKFFEDNIARLPIALCAESRSPMKLAAFLAAARAFIDQSSPGLTKWETLTYKEQPYAKIRASEDRHEIAIYYVTLPTALVITTNEELLHRAIDRLRGGAATQVSSTAPATRPVEPWLGTSLALRIGPELAKVITRAMNPHINDQLQASAWTNIAILNEWKRLFPQQDPLKVHEKLLGVRLLDPLGGSYTWNDEWHTMQSANYGHPGEPKTPAKQPWLMDATSADFGVSFENQGLRARGVLAVP